MAVIPQLVDAALHGWGVRPSDWQLTASLDHQIGAKSSIGLTYVRRWYDGFISKNFSIARNLSRIPFV